MWLYNILDIICGFYFSPSGCTFWGKKPWSRKKKVLWQLGMLVGAPVVIALIAGIAVPAIMIGVPIWVGRKVCICNFIGVPILVRDQCIIVNLTGVSILIQV